MACKPPAKIPPVMAPVIAATVAVEAAGTIINDVEEDALYCVSLILSHGKEDLDSNRCWLKDAGRAVGTKGEDGIKPWTEFSVRKRTRHDTVDVFLGPFILFVGFWTKYKLVVLLLTADS
jgi:hypothetical protein